MDHPLLPKTEMVQLVMPNWAMDGPFDSSRQRVYVADDLVSVRKWQAAFYAQKGFLGIGKSPSRMNPTRGKSFTIG
ncbi:hypothetical protein YC2023_118042 [Brassica napus]